MKTITTTLLTLVLLLASGYLNAQTFKERQLRVVAKKYQLNYSLDFESKTLSASGSITIKNISTSATDHIPLRLYRMISVSAINNTDDAPLSFTQQILSNEDWPVFQSNYIEVALTKPLKPQESYTFEISFSGALRGYQETGMSYVKDSISDDFSIIRMDSFAYPLVSYPNDNINREAKFWLYNYDYDMIVTVPNSHVVANGGELVSKKENHDLISYRYKNKLPVWRMDFAVAKYQFSSSGKYTIFSWQPKKDVDRVLQAVNDTVNLYSDWFGPLSHELGYSIIQVPENYGAQADITSVIQDATGFKGVENLDKVYHELSHQWNVKSLDKFSPRWDEGQATFLEALTLDHLHLPGHLEKHTKQIFTSLKKTFAKNKTYRNTAYIDYGKKGLNAYSVGMVFFRLMFDIVGQDDFNKLIGGFYQTYYTSGATTEQFINYMLKNSKTDLALLFNQWAYSAEYAKLISQSEGYSQLLSLYQ